MTHMYVNITQLTIAAKTSNPYFHAINSLAYMFICKHCHSIDKNNDTSQKIQFRRKSEIKSHLNIISSNNFIVDILSFFHIKNK